MFILGVFFDSRVQLTIVSLLQVVWGFLWVGWLVLGFTGVDGQVISKNISENEC